MQLTCVLKGTSTPVAFDTSATPSATAASTWNTPTVSATANALTVAFELSSTDAAAYWEPCGKPATYTVSGAILYPDSSTSVPFSLSQGAIPIPVITAGSDYGGTLTQVAYDALPAASAEPARTEDIPGTSPLVSVAKTATSVVYPTFFTGAQSMRMAVCAKDDRASKDIDGFSDQAIASTAASASVTIPKAARSGASTDPIVYNGANQNVVVVMLGPGTVAAKPVAYSDLSDDPGVRVSKYYYVPVAVTVTG